MITNTEGRFKVNKNLAQLVAEFVFETTYLHFFSLNRFEKEDL